MKTRTWKMWAFMFYPGVKISPILHQSKAEARAAEDMFFKSAGRLPNGRIIPVEVREMTPKRRVRKKV
jgi:hypothetical protein